jgi:hypothetical protein
VTTTDHFSLNQLKRSEAKLHAALIAPSLPARQRSRAAATLGVSPRTIRRAERARQRRAQTRER